MILSLFVRRLGGTLLLVAAAFLAGCAVSPSALQRDPWEPYNREVADFNEGLDAAVLKPVATAYQRVTPALVRKGVSNVFANVSDVWSLANNVLQLKPRESAETLLRVGVNTTFGLGGLLDVASELGLQRHREDFGQTLGYWGVPTGPYVVLPVLGPSTVRDSLALPLDWQVDPIGNLSHVPLRNSLTALRAIDTRTDLLRVGNLLDDAALDKYSFTRDAYLQRRGGLAAEDLSPRGPAEERFDLPEAAPKSDSGPSGSTSPLPKN